VQAGATDTAPADGHLRLAGSGHGLRDVVEPDITGAVEACCLHALLPPIEDSAAGESAGLLDDDVRASHLPKWLTPGSGGNVKLVYQSEM
jgi:hypothetical protein